MFRVNLEEIKILQSQYGENLMQMNILDLKRIFGTIFKNTLDWDKFLTFGNGKIIFDQINANTETDKIQIEPTFFFEFV